MLLTELMLLYFKHWLNDFLKLKNGKQFILYISTVPSRFAGKSLLSSGRG